MADVPREKRTFPGIVDFRAQCSPERPFAFLPRSERLEDGFVPLTYAALAKAVDRTSWWLDEVLGGTVGGGATPRLPYIGENDIRYALLVIAAVKTKRAMMLPFPANTPQGLTNLVRSTGGTVVLGCSSQRHIWTAVHNQMESLRIIEVPEVAYFINEQSVKHYGYLKGLDEAIDDVTYVIQTSGNPQPITYTHRSSSEDYLREAMISLQSPGDQKLALYELVRESYTPIFLPFSWLLGLVSLVAWPLVLDSVPLLAPAWSTQPITATFVGEMSKVVPRGSKNGLILVPDTLRSLAKNPEHLKALSRWEWIAYAGAPLDHVTGDLIAKTGIRVQSLMGSTDSGAYPLLLNDAGDWKIHRLHPDVGGHHLKPYTDDLYELCINRQPDDPRHCFVKNPRSATHGTKDLWAPVPGREGFYTNAGRVDDFIKLATMTKFNAVSFEQALDGHASVEKSLVAGDSRERPFAIIQPAISADEARDNSLNLVWPAVEEANKIILPEARLTRELIIITAPDMPIRQTAKGTVDRRSTIKMYAEKVEEVYEKAKFRREIEGRAPVVP